MLSVELASHHPAEVAASSAEGQITHVGGHVVHLFNDEHFSKARLSLKVDSHFLDDFDFGDLGATGGKSGEVLAFTPSKRFIVKSIHGTEHETLLNLAPRLCAHLDQNDKLLCSFLLHFEIRGDSAAAGCYFVMNNCLPILDKARFQFKYTFDLKGCIDDKMMVNDGEKVKQVHRRDGCCWFGCDIEWSICNTAERKKYMEGKQFAREIEFIVPADAKAYIDRVLRTDVDFLQNTIQTMDYSLMIGVVETTRADVPDLPETDYPHQPFVSFDGEKATAYYFGIIDYLTEWTVKKRMAHIIKCLCAPKPIATVNPGAYGARFLDYLEEKFVVAEAKSPLSRHVESKFQAPARVWEPDFFVRSSPARAQFEGKDDGSQAAPKDTAHATRAGSKKTAQERGSAVAVSNASQQRQKSGSEKKKKRRKKKKFRTSEEAKAARLERVRESREEAEEEDGDENDEESSNEEEGADQHESETQAKQQDATETSNISMHSHGGGATDNSGAAGNTAKTALGDAPGENRADGVDEKAGGAGEQPDVP